MALTLVDSLDTMLVMNLQEEFGEAEEWVRDTLSFDIDGDINVFEITIRVLGGLLSTFHLSREKLYLDKAVDLAGKVVCQGTAYVGGPDTITVLNKLDPILCYRSSL